MRTKSSIRNKINIITLGCSKNIYDSEVLMGQLKANNKNVVHEKDGNIVVVNTCGFIENAKQESINTILEQSKNKRDGKIDKLYVTGCLSERYKDDLIIQIPEVDQYFGTTDLPSLLKVLDANYKHELVGERILTTPKHYAYLKISEGCNRPCSFCAIPLMRGKHRSIPIEKLVFQAKKLASEGVVEIILIAQDLTYYGLDLYKKRCLAKLLKELVKVEGIHWIRLHYAFPTGFPLDVLEVIKNNNKICNYLDIPLQHISDDILKSMRRGSDSKKINGLIKSIRKKIPGIILRTTLIVGYPDESKEDFNLLKEWVEKTKFERLGCFTYSHEENTNAYNLDDNVSEKVKKERVNQIMKIQSKISLDFNKKCIGKIFNCLIDRKEGSFYIGRTFMDSPDVDNEVLIDATKNYIKIGSFLRVKIKDVTNYDLIAEVY